MSAKKYTFRVFNNEYVGKFAGALLAEDVSFIGNNQEEAEWYCRRWADLIFGCPTFIVLTEEND